MRLAALLIVLLTSSATLAGEVPLCKDQFNLIQLNRSHFRLLTEEPSAAEAKKLAGVDEDKLKKQEPTLPPPKIELVKPEPKAEPKPEPPKRITGDIYYDADGKLRRVAEDKQGDWYYDGKTWWRYAKTQTTTSPPSLIPNCPNGRCTPQR